MINNLDQKEENTERIQSTLKTIHLSNLAEKNATDKKRLMIKQTNKELQHDKTNNKTQSKAKHILNQIQPRCITKINKQFQEKRQITKETKYRKLLSKGKNENR